MRKSGRRTKRSGEKEEREYIRDVGEGEHREVKEKKKTMMTKETTFN